MDADLPLRLEWRPFHFRLSRELVTAHGALAEKRGWLLRLEAADGRLGWGEAAALRWGEQGGEPSEPLAEARLALGSRLSRSELERRLPRLPRSLAFACGLALAELDGRVGGAGGWLPAPVSALLLPAGEAMPEALEQALGPLSSPGPGGASPLTCKWKVAAGDDRRERQLLEWLLERLPPAARLRLDANGGWDRSTAAAWASRLASESRLDWLEQPLPPADGEGLRQLVQQVPVALDESLRCLESGSCQGAEAGGPFIYGPDWPGWLVRRPALEGDPRPLLAALQAGQPRLMLSTALETGIGMRLLAHLAALQQQGPTPTAPGLAPGWRPAGGLFDPDPALVWAAAGGEGP